MHDQIYVYVPSANQIIRIAEGSGDNLLDEDIDSGYVDYIYYEQYALEAYINEVDGGQVMLTQMFQKKFKSTKECVPYVLDMAYGDDSLPYIVLEEDLVI